MQIQLFCVPCEQIYNFCYMHFFICSIVFALFKIERIGSFFLYLKFYACSSSHLWPVSQTLEVQLCVKVAQSVIMPTYKFIQVLLYAQVKQIYLFKLFCYVSSAANSTVYLCHGIVAVEKFWNFLVKCNWSNKLIA